MFLGTVIGMALESFFRRPYVPAGLSKDKKE
jgi:hypothetical protein